MRLRKLGVMCVFGVLAACGSSDSKTTPLTLTATIGSGAVPTLTNAVKADGQNVVTIEVSGAMTAPIRVTTPRGSFAGGGRTATIDGVSGSVDLITCDASTDSGCAGTLVVTAFDGDSAAGTLQITFVGFESTCNDSGDNNDDGRVDCADPDCQERACMHTSGNAGICMAAACILPVCTPTGAEACDNHVDDDCDLDVDCQQDACDNQPCKQGSPTFVCRTGVCTDLGSGFGLDVTTARTRLPADGKATTTVTVTVTSGGAPQAGTQLDLTTDLGVFVVGAGTVASTSVSTGADGKATATFRASDTSGTATITAAIHAIPLVNQSALVTMPALGSIGINSIQNQVMGVKTSGFNEQNQISVLLLDTEQRPYPDGLDVRFEHQQLGGSTISEPLTPDTATCIAVNGCIGYLGKTASGTTPDTGGLATVNLYAGTAAGPVSIAVSAVAGQTPRSFTVQNIAIVGAKASGAKVSVFCSPLNVPALIEQDCTNTGYNGQGSTISCTVFLADRFNNVLGVATRAEFKSESGSAGPPVLTKAYDPVLGGDQSGIIGRATNSVQVRGFRLPSDVPPLAGEFNLSYDDQCGTKVHNPRDGLGAVMVSVQGEEGFVDQNGDGVYQQGEPFIDSGEPFVDENDNGVRDGNEYFTDVNQNGIWDGPNGEWDADTVVWAETRVVYTGFPRFGQWLDSPFPPPSTPPTFQVAKEQTITLPMIFSDENFNVMSGFAVYSIEALNGNVTARYAPNPSTVDTLGMSFTQQYCDVKPPGTPTACFSTCQSDPCYRVSRVSNFAYGTPAQGAITGAKAGPDTVQTNVTLGGIEDPRSIPVTGSCVP